MRIIVSLILLVSVTLSIFVMVQRGKDRVISYALNEKSPITQINITEVASDENYLKDYELKDSDDYFLLATELFELAVQGDLKSQFRLAQILKLCVGAALYRDQLNDAIFLLQNRADIISGQQLRKVQSVITRCSDFHPWNFELFLPQESDFFGEYSRIAQYDAFSYQWYAVTVKTESLLQDLTENINLLSLLWMGQAAKSGYPAAMAEIMFFWPDGVLFAELDNTQGQQHFESLLAQEAPEALLGLGGCFELSGSEEIGIVLQSLACQQGQDCFADEGFNAMRFRQFLVMSLSLTGVDASHANQEAAMENFKYLNNQESYASYLHQRLQDLPDYKGKVKQMGLDLQSTSFQVELFQSCVCTVTSC